MLFLAKADTSLVLVLVRVLQAKCESVCARFLRDLSEYTQVRALPSLH